MMVPEIAVPAVRCTLPEVRDEFDAGFKQVWIIVASQDVVDMAPDLVQLVETHVPVAEDCARRSP